MNLLLSLSLPLFPHFSLIYHQIESNLLETNQLKTKKLEGIDESYLTKAEVNRAWKEKKKTMKLNGDNDDDSDDDSDNEGKSYNVSLFFLPHITFLSLLN